MNSIKIEKRSILYLKNAVAEHDLMNDYINDNDKEPSWDGLIYLYTNSNLKVEYIKYRVPVQIKGKNQQDLLERQMINYSVEYKHLRNYFTDGGVFYFVIVISDDGKKASIFYNALTTIKLYDLLKDTDMKKGNQQKSIVLKKLKKNDTKELYKALSQFGYDREKQGSGNGPIIEKAININVIDKVDSIQATSFTATNEFDALKEISTGAVCLYGHRSDIDMWLPFDFKQQQTMMFRKISKIYKSIGIDGKLYYDSYTVEFYNENKAIIVLSENLQIDFINGKINLKPHGNIVSLKNDVEFLYAVLNGNAFYLENKEIIAYNNPVIPSKLKDNMDKIIDIYKAFNIIGFNCDKKSEDFTAENWEAINELLNIYYQNIKPKCDNENAWYMLWWDGKVIPIFLIKNSNGEIEIVNWFTTQKYAVFTEKENGEHYKLPNYIFFKRDIWEKLYDVDESILFNIIERLDFSLYIQDEMYQLFVEILAAYDMTKNEIYYDLVTLIISRLLEVDPENEFGIINNLQVIKRKQSLSKEEIVILEKLEKNTNNNWTICAVNILLENKHRARKLIDELSEEDQTLFKGFPIYNML